MTRTEDVLIDIAVERARQEKLREAGKFRASCATVGLNEMTDPDKLAVLGEELGEALEHVFTAIDLSKVFGRVARAVTEGIAGNVEYGRTELRKELVEVAAVAVAWIESIDQKKQEGGDPVATRTEAPITAI